MSEEALPPLPESTPKPAPSDPPSFWKMFFLGMGLFVASVFLAPLLIITIPAAIVLLFFRDARALGAGYLAGLGLALLALIIVCGVTGPPDFK
jgi:hypothetical protein